MYINLIWHWHRMASFSISKRHVSLCDRITRALAPRYASSTLLLILHQARATVHLQLGFRDEAGSISSDLDWYDNNYEIMTNDAYRNAFFRGAIEELSPGGPHGNGHRWFEIGPGADGCLTKMVLDAHPANTVLAVEGSAPAVKKVTKNLARYIRTGRLQVLNGIVGESGVPEAEADVLVAEILGHWASSEGYCEVLRASGIRCSDTIPRYFGTCIVPVDLSLARHLVPTMVGSKVCLFRAFPFADAALAGAQDMESYSGLAVLQQGTNTDPVRTSLKFAIQRGGTFHGFSTYLFYCQHEDRRDLRTSIVSADNTATNWNHCFLPFGPLEVTPDHTVELECICDVFQREPRYEFHVTVKDASNQTLLEDVLAIDYKDIYTLLVKVKDVLG
jgi:hypothetical protein